MCHEALHVFLGLLGSPRALARAAAATTPGPRGRVSSLLLPLAHAGSEWGWPSPAPAQCPTQLFKVPSLMPGKQVHLWSVVGVYFSELGREWAWRPRA